MRKRWRLTEVVDWELAVVMACAVWFGVGVLAMVIAGAVFNSPTAVDLAGALTSGGMAGIPLLAGLAYGVTKLRGHKLLRREWESGPDLRERYRS